MEAARFEVVYGIPYLVVSLSDSWWDLYVPIELEDDEGFYEQVPSYISRNHPLYEWVAPVEAD